MKKYRHQAMGFPRDPITLQHCFHCPNYFHNAPSTIFNASFLLQRVTYDSDVTESCYT